MKKAFNSARAAQCLELLDETLKAQPDDAFLWHERAVLLSMQPEREAEAYASFAKALRIEPDCPTIAQSFAHFLSEKADTFSDSRGETNRHYAYAEKLYLTARQESGDGPVLLASLGQLYNRQEEFHLAAACFGKACDYALGDALAEQSRNHQADHGIVYSPELWDGFERHAEITLAARPYDPTAARLNLRLDNLG